MVKADDGDSIGLSTDGFLPWRREAGHSELVVTAKVAAALPFALSPTLLPWSTLVAFGLVGSGTPAPDA